MPGLGSFFGTIIGTLLGDAFAGDPANPKATHDVEILGSDLHFQNRLVGTDDHGNAAISQAMGDQVTDDRQQLSRCRAWCCDRPSRQAS